MNSNAFIRSGTEYQLSDENLSSQPKASQWKGERGVLPNAKLFGSVWPSVLQYTADHSDA